MSQRIDLDHGRFRQIIRGKIKQNLRKYISQGEMIARKGKDSVSIPLPQVDLPRFKWGDKQGGGVGQGGLAQQLDGIHQDVQRRAELVGGEREEARFVRRLALRVRAGPLQLGHQPYPLGGRREGIQAAPHDLAQLACDRQDRPTDA